MVIAAALIGMVARGLVEGYCHDTDVLELGRAATGYCSSVDGTWSWGAFVVAAVAITGLVRVVRGSRRFARPVALATVFLALIANTIIVYSL